MLLRSKSIDGADADAHLVLSKFVHAFVEFTMRFFLPDFIENKYQGYRDQTAANTDYQTSQVTV